MDSKKSDAAISEVAQDSENTVVFNKPFHFEGEDYAGVDLTKLEDLTAKDMASAEKYLSKQGIISPVPEMTIEYVCFIAHLATGHPIEFFQKLPPRDAVKVKNAVTGFFYGVD